MALGLEGPAAARLLISKYLALRPAVSEAQGMRLLDAMLDPARTRSPEVQRMLDMASADALFSLNMATRSWPDSADIVLRSMRALLRPRAVTSRLMAHEAAKQLPSAVLGMHGHLREALRAPPVYEGATTLAGQLGILPDDSVRAAMGHSSDPLWNFGRWLAARGDTLGLKALVRRADSLAHLPGQGPDRRRSATLAPQTARAYLALARRDTAGALAALDAVPDSLLGRAHILRLTKAQLLAAHGRDREAAQVLDEIPWDPRIFPVLVLIDLERARVAERLGEVPRAVEGYQYVVGMWRHADPELQPFVDEARQALGRLTAEPRQ
jgi:hypothetical protein